MHPHRVSWWFSRSLPARLAFFALIFIVALASVHVLALDCLILGLSERTVNFHCDQAMRRLDVINRVQAVAKALSEGLITT